MKKVLIGIGILIIVGIIAVAASSKGQESFQKGLNQGKNTIQQGK
jgi:hypothetical protein